MEGRQFVAIIGPELRRFHPGLVCEVGRTDQRPREFVISADGIREHVNAVETLADAAPPLPDWKITRFRPRVPEFEAMTLEFDDVVAHPSRMKFIATTHGPLVDLQIFADWRSPSQDNRPDGPTFIMLDIALGEYDMICRVGSIAVHPLDAAPESARPWPEIRDALDELSDQTDKGPSPNPN